MRVEPLSMSLRVSDIFFQVNPTGSDFGSTVDFLCLLVDNKLSEAINFTRKLDEPDRLYHAWLLSMIVHERMHVLQYMCTTTAAHMKRRTWLLAANIPNIISLYAKSKKFFFKYSNNLDPFLCETFGIDQIPELNPLKETRDRSDGFIDRGTTTSFDRFIESTGKSASASNAEIEVRKAEVKNGYLSAIKVLELWAYSEQISFIKSRFPIESNKLINGFLEPLINNFAGDYIKTLRSNTGIDFFIADNTQRSVINLCFFFALNTGFGSRGGEREEIEDVGMRLYLQTKILSKHANISPQNYCELILTLQKAIFTNPFENLFSDFDRDSITQDLLTQTQVKESAEFTFRSSKYLSAFEAFSGKRESIVKSLISDEVFLKSNAVLDYVERSFQPPLVLESNSMQTDAAMEQVKDDWQSTTKDWTHLSPASVTFDEEMQSSQLLWTRTTSNRQNIFPDEFMRPSERCMLERDSKTNSPFDVLVSRVEPTLAVLNGDFSSVQLLKFERQRIRKGFSRIGEGISISGPPPTYRGEYFAYFDQRDLRCDMCNKPVQMGDGVFWAHDFAHRIKIENNHPGFYIINNGYHYVHEECVFNNVK